MKCDVCGKSPKFGNTVSHSKRHTARTWEPNVHPARVMKDGKMQRLNVCTRCLRTINKQSKQPTNAG
ncbi:MAG TPA: 50S ribosomal protein L28 [Dehalococcoidales bacterium]|nr:50S ribosomal protein L28 [Dehalococcoidales bacterium]